MTENTIGIWVCLDAKPFKGPFDTWKDAWICADLCSSFFNKSFDVTEFKKGGDL